MDNKKIVIICLILMLAIFFIGLSLNLIEKPNGNIGVNSSQQEQNKAASEQEWVKAIDTLLSPFANSLTVQDVTLSCPHTASGFTLSSQISQCRISVPGFSEGFKKLRLKPDSRAAALVITYLPNGEAEQKNHWPEPQNDGNFINFVLLGKAEAVNTIMAEITVTCANCINQQTVNIAFE
jgi:hypothetical protein